MKNMWKTFCLFVLLLTFAAVAEGAVRKVFIFGGQSNMAGADSLINGTGAQNLVGAGLQTDADRNALFSYTLAFNANNTPTYPVNSPGYGWGDVRGHVNSNPNSYVIGPEVGFERTLYAAGIRDVAIIAVSNNIQTLGPPWPWTNKDPNSTPPDFYNHWSAFVNARLGELTSQGDTYTIAGFVWDEGIDDAMQGSTTAQYEANLTQLISQLRSDFGTPTTPFVLITSRSDMVSPAAMEAVRVAQVAVANADPHAAWVTSDGLPNVNTHHFPASSQLVIGQREGDAYLALITPEPGTLVMLASGMIGVFAWAWRKR